MARSRPTAFKKGNPGGPGRKKGVPNKATDDLRKFLKSFCEKNADKMQGWLDRTARKDPLGALKVLEALCEFSLPKLSRTEMVGDPNQPIEVALRKAEELARLEDPTVSAAHYQDVIGALH